MLSDLQMALLGAGAVAIAGVWGYNWWQERKARRTAQAIFQQVHADTLLAERPATPERREPVFAAETPETLAAVDADAPHGVPDRVAGRMDVAAGASAAASFSASSMTETFVEPVMSASAMDVDATATSAYAPVVEAAVLASGEPVESVAVAESTESTESIAFDDAPATAAPAATVSAPLPEFPVQYAESLVDCVVHLHAASPVPAPAVWVLQESWAAQLSKPVRWLVHNDGGHWQPLAADETGRFTEWVAALQLADRRGAVSAGELTHFFNGVQQVAEKIGATVDLPAAAEQIVAHANALDEFCAGVDIQFKLHIVESTGGVFSGTKLRGMAEAAGMTLEDDGRFHARDADGSELYTLVNFGSEGFTADTLRSLATHGLTLIIDVPRVGDGVTAFNRMLLSGQRLARALDGVLVDAQRAPLAENMIAAIRAKIGELQKTMRDSGIVPGSALALRLFS